MIELTSKGLFCAAGGFHIDPNRRVDLALITHAHSDHARKGSRHYICAEPGQELLARRIGLGSKITTVRYGEVLRFGEAKVSFHPAGHILGSAQIRVELGSEVWVVSGDYKRDNDPTCAPFEVLPCDTFITEATFGNPKYQWTTEAQQTGHEIYNWWQENRDVGQNSILFAYALGKTQRILAELAAHTDQRVLVFGEAHELTECYRRAGVRMVPTTPLESLARRKIEGELIVAPHSLAHSNWMDKLGQAQTAFASGWMQTGAWGMSARYDRGFVLSDHADWPSLVKTIQETNAKRILILHGKEGSALMKHLRKIGIDASIMLKEEEMQKKDTSFQGNLFFS